MYKKIIVFFVLSFFFAGQTVAAVDPNYIDQWYLSAIKADTAWSLTTGSSEVVVAVIDTGVDLDHPDLVGNIWVNADEIAGDNLDNDKNGYVDDVNGWNFFDKTNDPQPNLQKLYSTAAVSHGTFIAGLIAAVHDNGIAIKGVAPKVKIMPLAALDGNGDGESSAVTSAIRYAVKNGADVINLSFGGEEKSASLKEAIEDAYAAGVVIVAAAGNAQNGNVFGTDMTDEPLYPICYDREFSENKIIGVASSGKTSRFSSFSNYGKDCVDIAAPGESIISLLYYDARYNDFKSMVSTNWKGSSFSTALVSAAAAMMKSYKPDITPKQITETLLQESSLLMLSDSLYNGKAGQGILNIDKALKKLGVVSVADPVIVNPVIPDASAPANQDLSQPVTTDSKIYASQKGSGSGVYRVFDSSFKIVDEIKVFSGADFHGLNFATNDVDADGAREIIASAVKGDQPFVRILDNNTIDSSFLAFPSTMTGGVNVVAANLDADAESEIIVAPESGYSPSIKIFEKNGKFVRQFTAYNIDYRNGVNVAAGDVDKDGKVEIVTAPKKGLLPKIKIFSADGKLKYEFVAHSAKSSNGANVTVADTNNDGSAEIIVSAESGDIAYVIVYDYKGAKKLGIAPYPKFTGGVDCAVYDWNRDGVMEIATAAGKSGGPHVKIFSNKGALLGQFFAWHSSFTGGVNIDGF